MVCPFRAAYGMLVYPIKFGEQVRQPSSGAYSPHFSVILARNPYPIPVVFELLNELMAPPAPKRRSASACANIGHGTRQRAHEPLAASASHSVVKK